MLSEGLTTYRTGKESRRRLFHESPQLYETAQKYDEEEIARYYGVDGSGHSQSLRTPEGIVVPRTSEAEAELSSFEQSLKFAP
jgi:hypothetical protein